MIVQHSESVRLRKDYGTFGGANKWTLEVLNHRGNWVDVQWLSRLNAEGIVGYGKLPRFEIRNGRVTQTDQ